MKLYIFQTPRGIVLRKPPYPVFTDEEVLGTIEVIEVEEPKREVTKEAVGVSRYSSLGYMEYNFQIPVKGKNIKCTYEIKE